MQYWIIINKERRGPVSREQLRLFPEFGLETPVWRQGLADWTTAGQLPEAAEIFGSMATGPGPAPQPAQPQVVYVQGPGPAPAPAPAKPGGDGERPEMPPTYLVWAILSTLCCCLVTGIVAIIYSSKVAPLYNRGDFEGARKASERAGWWVIITFVTGLIWTPFYTLYSLLTASV